MAGRGMVRRNSILVEDVGSGGRSQLEPRRLNPWAPRSYPVALLHLGRRLT